MLYEVITDVTKYTTKMKEHIGVCPQEAAVFKFLTGRENIELLGNLHGVEKEVLRERTTSLLDEADQLQPSRRRSAKRRPRVAAGGRTGQGGARAHDARGVITSYSIHYTKLYEVRPPDPDGSPTA